MINLAGAFGSAAITMLIALSCSFFAFYLLYFKGYLSGSRSASAKARLILGLIATAFFFQGSSLIIGELVGSYYKRVHINEDEIFRGLLVAAPPLIIASILGWCIGLFESREEISPKSAIYSNIKEAPSVEEQLRKSDAIFYTFIISIVGLPILVSNWNNLSTIDKPAVDASAERRSSSVSQLSTIVGTQSATVMPAASQVRCNFLYLPMSGKFIRTESDYSGNQAFSIISLITPHNREYIEELMARLRRADLENNSSEASFLAQEIDIRLLKIFYENDIDKEPVENLAASQDLMSQCK
jgi:hypothetical protein